jgi:WD40 repeat protein
MEARAPVSVANRPIKVFISYSRKDVTFVDELQAALMTRNYDVAVDRQDIEKGEEWWARIRQLIAQADAVVFIVSPDSIESKVANDEVNYALQLGKRLVPLVWRTASAPPRGLAERNYIYANALGAPPFEATAWARTLNDLEHAINLNDILWVREHTRWVVRSTDWEAAGKPDSMVLRAGQIIEVQSWASRRPITGPEIPPSVLSFVDASLKKEARDRRRTQALQMGVGALIAIALLVVLLGAYGVTRLMSGIGSRTSSTLAEVARAANESSRHERAMRYAIVGLSGYDAPLLGFDGEHAYAELARAAVASREVASTPSQGKALTHAALSADGRTFATARADFVIQVWNSANASLVAVMNGHTTYITALKFSPDGGRLLSSSYDHTARIWDVTSGRELARLQGPGIVHDAEFSPDGKNIVTAGEEGMARLWDATTGQQIGALVGHRAAVLTAVYDPSGGRIVTASQDNTARVWDAESRRLLQTLEGDGTPLIGEERGSFIQSAQFSPDGSRILTTAYDHTAAVWNATSGARVSHLVGHSDFITNAHFSPDGARIVTAGRSDRSVRVWNATTGNNIAQLNGHEDLVDTAVFCANGARVVSASYDGTARIWDADNGMSIAILDAARGQVYAALTNSDCSQILTVTGDGAARIWDGAERPLNIALRGHTGGVEGARFSPDGASVLTVSSEDGTTRTWDRRTGRLTHLISTGASNDVEWSPDTRSIAVASSDGTANVVDAATGENRLSLRGHQGSVHSIAYNQSGALIVTASSDHTARLWDARSGAILSVLRGHSGEVNEARFDPTGHRVVTASSDQTAIIWDASTGRRLMTLNGHERGLRDAVFSPDGARVVTASNDNTARLWSSGSGQWIATLEGHRDEVTSAKFSPDGKYILTTSHDSTARIWDSMGQQVAVLRHDRAVVSAEFSPDSRFVVTASYDGSAGVFDAANGRVIARLGARTMGPMYEASFSPDGADVATASNARIAQIWHLTDLLSPSRELINRICGSVLRNQSVMSDAELEVVPAIDPRLDRDVCRATSPWIRLGAALGG